MVLPPGDWDKELLLPITRHQKKEHEMMKIRRKATMKIKKHSDGKTLLNSNMNTLLVAALGVFSKLCTYRILHYISYLYLFAGNIVRINFYIHLNIHGVSLVKWYAILYYYIEHVEWLTPQPFPYIEMAFQHSLGYSNPALPI